MRNIKTYFRLLRDIYIYIHIYIYVLRDKLTYVVNNSKLAQMNTQRNDVWRTDGPRCDQHFQMPGHNLMLSLGLLSLKRFIISHCQR